MNYIKEYYDEISSGKIIAGNKIKKIYEKLVKEMDDSSLPFYFDEKKGERPIQFIETFCRQSEGQIGEPIKLELFQRHTSKLCLVSYIERLEREGSMKPCS